MIKGNLVNLFTEEIYPAEVEIQKGKIKCVREVKEELDNYILPGFIDAHIHIESSMLTPSRFAQMVVPHGTTAVVADPHEIANVQGLAGVNYMIQDAANVPLQFFFTAPSCVPATPFETSGAVLGPEEIDNLLQRDDVVALGEMMNVPGVIGGDPVVLEKIRLAHEHSKPVDGHAPLLSGDDLCNYIARGISTEHECSLREEALEKKRLGMRIMVREGSSAQNLEELWTVGGDFLVSDDRHPQDLLEGHLDQTLKKAVELGMDPLKAIQMVTVHPASHYHLDTGSVTPGKSADLVVVDDLEKFNVKKVFIKGELVAREGKPLFNVQPLTGENTFQLKTMMPSDFEIQSTGNGENTVRVIEVMEGQLLTEKSQATLESVNGILPGDIEQDVLQIAVVERYGNNHHSNAFVKGFSLKKGAIASSVAHDSHNIIVVGTNTKDMAVAVNTLKKNRGGLVTVGEGVVHSLKLPIAGLMSTQSAEEVANQLNQLQEFTKAMGCKLSSPFMTLSFMALLVIPKLKISDQGLFDGESFQFVDVIK